MAETVEKETHEDWKRRVREVKEELKQFIRQAYKDKTL